MVLPKTDVNRLYRCLELELERCIEQLQNKFDHTIWVTLNKVVLIKLLIFNRKRPGDIERPQIVEYETMQTIDNETLLKLDAAQRKYAVDFGRYITRGKLDSPAILVSKNERNAIKLILKYRLEAKVDKNNPYLFAAPPGGSDPFYKAGKSLQDFCYLTNMQNKNLTATKLRKHLATLTCTLNEDVVKRISNFMGHSDKYHHNIYVQRPIVNDVTEMGQVLSYAMGRDTNNDNSATNLVEHMDCIENTESEEKSDFQGISKENSNDSSISEYHSDDDNFEPDLSRISEESDGEIASKIQYSKNKYKRKYKMKKSRINKKATWTTPERTTVRDMFKQYLTEGEHPSLETCQEFIHKNSILKYRSAVQVRAWIIEEKKTIKRQ